MSKQRKGNRESKKPKAVSNGNKKQKKLPKTYGDTVVELFGPSK